MIEIVKIWVFNGSINDDDCDNELISIVNKHAYDEGLYYLSWIRFNVNFVQLNDKNEWDEEWNDIIELFSHQLRQMECFINDTISIYYCQSDDTTSSPLSSSSSDSDLTMFSIIGTICIMGFFVCVAICGSVDAMFCRRNEIFSNYSILSAAAYTTDFFSGMLLALF